MAVVTGSGYEITYISVCIHDSNEIPTTIPMLSRSSIMMALVRILSYVMVSGISKIAAYNRKCLRNNVYLSFYTSAVMIHDLKNISPLEFHCCHVYMLRYTLFHIYFRFQASIFNFSLTPTNGSF